MVTVIKILLIGKLLLWLAVPVANAFADRKGQKRDYLHVNGVRALCFILWASLVMRIIRFDAYGLYLLLYALTTYWVVFELLLNHLRNNALLYFDMKEKDSGFVDRFFAWCVSLNRNFGIAFHAGVKVLAFAAAVAAFKWIYTNVY